MSAISRGGEAPSLDNSETNADTRGNVRRSGDSAVDKPSGHAITEEARADRCECSEKAEHRSA